MKQHVLACHINDIGTKQNHARRNIQRYGGKSIKWSFSLTYENLENSPRWIRPKPITEKHSFPSQWPYMVAPPSHRGRPMSLKLVFGNMLPQPRIIQNLDRSWIYPTPSKAIQVSVYHNKFQRFLVSCGSNCRFLFTINLLLNSFIDPPWS